MVLLRAYVVLDQEGVQMRDVRYFHRFDQAKVLRDEEVREASTAQLEVFPWPCARPVFCLSLPSVYIVSSNANALARLTNPAAPRDGPAAGSYHAFMSRAARERRSVRIRRNKEAQTSRLCGDAVSLD